MDSDLARAALFVQLLGDDCSIRTEELPQGYEGLQLERARALGRPILRWRRKDLAVENVRDARHRQSSRVLRRSPLPKRLASQSAWSGGCPRRISPPAETHSLLLVDQFEELFRFRYREVMDQSTEAGRAVYEARNEATAFVNLCWLLPSRQRSRCTSS